MNKFPKLKKLFVYGKLKPEYDKSDKLFDPKKDEVHGDLYSFNHDAEAKDFNKSKSDIDGYLTEASPKTIKTLDKIEAPQYKRVPITTESGKKAEAYEYERKLPKTATKIRNWKK